MRHTIFLSALLCVLAAAPSATAATGRVIKVLPQFLDLSGRHALSPSLYERDAYQAQLRLHPEQRSTMRFDIQWKSKGATAAPLKLRIELRGAAIHPNSPPAEITLEQPVKPGGWFSHWTTLTLSRKDYQALGSVTAWRATLWEGDRLLGEQKSFVW